MKNFFLDKKLMEKLEQMEQLCLLDGNKDYLADNDNYKGTNFVLTINNWNKLNLEKLEHFLSYSCKTYLFCKEIGNITKTPHLQGFIKTKSHKRYNTIMKEIGFNCYIKSMKGSLSSNINYCIKQVKNDDDILYCSDDIKSKIIIPEIIEHIPYDNLYDWQKNIYNLLLEKPNKRTIHWVYEPTGNVGKTELVKTIMLTLPKSLLFTGGKSNDITFQIINSNFNPKICLFDIPRTQEGFVSYNAIEQVKNGMVNSCKYEGGTKIFNIPHVIIFANFEPDKTKLSRDRWNIIDLSYLNMNDDMILDTLEPSGRLF